MFTFNFESEMPNLLAKNFLSILSSLIAMLAGLQVPFLCSETHELGEELVAFYLYQVHLYHRLEINNHGRFLSNNDI